MSLQQWGNDTVEAAQRNVGAFRMVNGKRRRIDSSGKLRNSFGFLALHGEDGNVLMKFTSSVEYAVFVESGVSGTETKYDTPFGYTDKMPPVDAIRGYMKAKPLRVRDARTGKFLKQSEKNKQSAAFAIAVNIRKHGMPPTHFMRDAVESMLHKLPAEYKGILEEHIDTTFMKYNSN